MSLRTTLTLEDDVASDLREAARRTGRPLKEVVNEALRAGLRQAEPRSREFRVRARAMGLRADVDLDDIEGLIEQLEGPTHR